MRHDWISGVTSDNAPREQARNIAALLYPDSMFDDWQERIASWDMPICYCIHDKDHLADGELDRKVHVHVFLRTNKTTLRYAKKLFETLCDHSKLQPDGKSFVTSCCRPVCKIENPRKKYDYLIHATERARKDGKYQYEPWERIELNDFDIGAYEQETESEKHEHVEELINYIESEQLCNMAELRRFLLSVSQPTQDDPERTAWDVYERTAVGFRAYLGDYFKAIYKTRTSRIQDDMDYLRKQNKHLQEIINKMCAAGVKEPSDN